MFQHMQIFTIIIYMFIHSVCIYVEPQRTYDPFRTSVRAAEDGFLTPSRPLSMMASCTSRRARRMVSEAISSFFDRDGHWKRCESWPYIIFYIYRFWQQLVSRFSWHYTTKLIIVSIDILFSWLIPHKQKTI